MSYLPNTLNSFWLWKEVSSKLGVSNPAYKYWKNTPNKDYIRNDGVLQVYFQDPDGYWIEVNNQV